MTKAVDPGDIYHMFNKFTGKYHCPRCTKTCGSKSGLRQHYQTHLGKLCDVNLRGIHYGFETWGFVIKSPKWGNRCPTKGTDIFEN